MTEEKESFKVFTHTHLPKENKGPLGPQIWIPRAWFRETPFFSHKVAELLSSASKWKREDKTSGRCRSWEFIDNETTERVAKELQENHGFAFIEPNDYFEKFGH